MHTVHKRKETSSWDIDNSIKCKHIIMRLAKMQTILEASGMGISNKYKHYDIMTNIVKYIQYYYYLFLFFLFVSQIGTLSSNYFGKYRFLG